MIASCDVIMAIVLDALLCILSVKVIFDKSFLKKFLFDWHFLFPREQTHVSISIFDLERPSMISNIRYSKASLRVSIKDSSDHVLALAREEFR